MPEMTELASTAKVPSRTELFLGFLGIAVVAFGGVLPWARYVLVERRRWLTPDEFSPTKTPLGGIDASSAWRWFGRT